MVCGGGRREEQGKYNLEMGMYCKYCIILYMHLEDGDAPEAEAGEEDRDHDLPRGVDHQVDHSGLTTASDH